MSQSHSEFAMNRKRTWLLLGGGGLICGEIAERLSASGDKVFSLDVRQQSIKKAARSYTGDALAPGVLDKFLAEIKPDGIINGINLATIFAREPAQGYARLVAYICGIHDALRNHLQRRGGDLHRPMHFLQLGTTGAGGLGFNIPFTHGEATAELPIIHKAAFSGITTSLLVLLSRSFEKGAVRVSEVKPGLAVFSDTVARETSADNWFCTTLDGGESGAYTYQELALLTRWMGFTTVKRVADRIMNVISDNPHEHQVPAHDVTSALNGSIIAQDEDDEKSKAAALREMHAADRDAANGSFVIASGNLGPAEITADLILARALMGGGELGQALRNDPAIRATLAYLTDKNPKLGMTVLKLCNADRLRTLRGIFNGSECEPWELVARKLGGALDHDASIDTVRRGLSRAGAAR
jgi:hypothetical protein